MEFSKLETNKIYEVNSSKINESWININHKLPNN